MPALSEQRLLRLAGSTRAAWNKIPTLCTLRVAYSPFPEETVLTEVLIAGQLMLHCFQAQAKEVQTENQPTVFRSIICEK